jgi:hypothetical protein
MTSGPELEYFENENNLTHSPGIDLDTWAERINKNNGACLCFSQRRCPCNEALLEIRNAKDERMQTCACQIFCTKEHFNYILEIERLRIEETKMLDPDEIKDPKIRGLIESINNAVYHLKNSEPMEAANTLEIEKEKHAECEICVGYMEECIQRSILIGATCAIDNAKCTEETGRTISRLMEIAKIYKQVDETSDTVQPPIESEIELTGKANVKNSPYHQCISKSMEEMKHLTNDQHARLKAATAICTGKAETIEEALELMGGKIDG